MDTFFGRFKNVVFLAAIVFAQVIGLAVQVKRASQEGDTRLIRVWAVGSVTPLEKGIVHAQHWVRGLWSNYLFLHNVRKENAELRRQIDQMKLDDVRLNEDAQMARRVQALLAFKEQYIDTTVAAQVIGTSGSEQSRILYIDKGSNDGIRNDMAVITPTGIVGKVVQVFGDSAQVLPINDQLSGVGAALKDSRLQGILKGAPNGATTLQYIMSDEKVVPGEEVVTSGGDHIFPKGLPVGKVSDVQPGKDLFLNIRVIPAARLDQLEEVLVVTKMVEKPPDTKDLGPIRASDILAERLPSVPTKTPAVDAAGNPAATNGTVGANPAGTTPNPNGAAAGTGAGRAPGTVAGGTAASGAAKTAANPAARTTTTTGSTVANGSSAGTSTPRATSPSSGGKPATSATAGASNSNAAAQPRTATPVAKQSPNGTATTSTTAAKAAGTGAAGNAQAKTATNGPTGTPAGNSAAKSTSGMVATGSAPATTNATSATPSANPASGASTRPVVVKRIVPPPGPGEPLNSAPSKPAPAAKSTQPAANSDGAQPQP